MSTASQPPVNHSRQLTLLVLAVVGMFGFGFALVPLYDVFCEITGLNGKTNSEAVAEISADRLDSSRLVTVEFIGRVTPGIQWQFEPTVSRVKLNPGEVNEITFRARSLAAQTTVGQAVPSVSPGQAAAYLNKIECFCFNRQELAAGAEILMPVRFFVDPDLPSDISTLTLSYTLYDVTDS